MRICFVVADVRAQQPTYAGIYLALAAHRRGADVRFVSVDDLSFLDNNTILATTRRVRHGDYDKPADYVGALASDDAVVEEDNLGSFDVIFLRYNPARESAGRMGAPLIDFAWRLRLGGTLVVNDPEGLRQVSNLNQIITTVTKHGYAIAQEYLPEIEEGEKRLLLLGAEPLRVGKRVAIYRRHTVIGNPESTATETSSTRSRCDFGPAEARICDLIRPKLQADGLYFVGVDIVGDKVLELNVFTPGGVHSLHELYGIDVAEVVIRDLERRVRLRAAYRTTFDPEAADVV